MQNTDSSIEKSGKLLMSQAEYSLFSSGEVPSRIATTWQLTYEELQAMIESGDCEVIFDSPEH